MTERPLSDLPAHLSDHLSVTPTGCWLWQGPVLADGYGRAYVPRQADGSGAYQARAHREVWAALVGPHTPGLQLDHLCRVVLCCRPAHLEEVTSAENTRRSAANGGDLYDPAPRPLACIYGHAYTDANTRVGSNGGYECRQCSRMRDRWRRALPHMPPEFAAIGLRRGYRTTTASASTLAVLRAVPSDHAHA